MKQLIALLGALLFAASMGAAHTLDSYSTDIHLAFGKAVMETEMEFEGNASGELLLAVPQDAAKISLYLDGQRVKPKATDGKLAIMLNETEHVRLNYISDSLLDKTEFLMTLVMPAEAHKATVTLTLPENAVLARSIADAGGSIFPKPDAATTDGKSLIFVWEWEDAAKDEELSFFVDYTYNGTWGWLAALVAIAVAGTLGYLVWKKAKRVPEPKAAAKPAPKQARRVPHADNPLVEPRPKALPMEKYLKEDEEQVVNILRQREGSCEQGTLRVITGFSKAKLSGLLKELEERNVVFKEKRGKRNLVFLREQEMNNPEPSPPQAGQDEP